MAGISFELRKILRRDNLSSLLWAYIYAGINSAGPLILSIVGILLVGIISLAVIEPVASIMQFQVSVTYLIATSLIVTGLLQLFFTRFISDQLFRREEHLVLSNYNAATLLITAAAGVLGVLAVVFLFRGEPLIYRVLMLMGFIVLCNVWLGVVLLASVKQYKVILLAFFVCYLIVVVLSLWLNQFGLEGLLGSFVIGHLVLFIILINFIHRFYYSDTYISWEITQRPILYPKLIIIGFLFNLGVWLDKFMFWFASTGQNVIGPLHVSVIYDIPIFMAYLCAIPGMAVFVLRLETEFIDHYNHFYEIVRSGGTFNQLSEARERMVLSVRTGLYDILKIQAIVTLLIFAFGDSLLRLLAISPLYLPLLKINVIAVSLQVIFLGVLNFFFYLDRLRTVLLLTVLFVLLNGALTALSLYLGPDAYGYGFAGALLIVVVLGVYFLNQRFDHLEYETYMLQPDL